MWEMVINAEPIWAGLVYCHHWSSLVIILQHFSTPIEFPMGVGSSTSQPLAKERRRTPTFTMYRDPKPPGGNKAPQKLHKKWSIMMNHWTITTYVSDDQASIVKKQIEKGRTPIVHKPSTSPTPSTMSYHEQPSTTVKHQQLCRENPWEATANTVPEPVSHSALCRLRVCEWLPSLLPALFERITSFLNLVEGWRQDVQDPGDGQKTKQYIT